MSDGRTAQPGDVTALAVRILTTYGIDATDVLGLTVELNPYGIQVLNVRLIITPNALHAMTYHPHMTNTPEEPDPLEPDEPDPLEPEPT